MLTVGMPRASCLEGERGSLNASRTRLIPLDVRPIQVDSDAGDAEGERGDDATRHAVKQEAHRHSGGVALQEARPHPGDITLETSPWRSRKRHPPIPIRRSRVLFGTSYFQSSFQFGVR